MVAAFLGDDTAASTAHAIIFLPHPPQQQCSTARARTHDRQGGLLRRRGKGTGGGREHCTAGRPRFPAAVHSSYAVAEWRDYTAAE